MCLIHHLKFIKIVCLLGVSLLVQPFLFPSVPNQGAASYSNLKPLIKDLTELERKNLLDGKVVIAKGSEIFFVAQNRELAARKEEPQYMIASLSKQFFAAALLKLLYDTHPGLHESERIANVKRRLTQPLSVFLPPQASVWNGHMPSWADHITPHHLLSHSSGLANYTEESDYDKVLTGGKRFYEMPHAKSSLIDLIADKPLLFPPGTQFSYSNTNYVLVAQIIEHLSNFNAATYLQNQIFRPLGLSSTDCPLQGGSEALRELPQFSRLAQQTLYDRKDHQAPLYPLHNNENVSNAMGSGSIISTATDLLKWNLALHRDRTVLPPSLYKMMVTPNLDGYGYGIGLATSQLGAVFRHRGQIDAYRSRLYYFPDADLSIIVLTSTNHDELRLEKEKMALMSALDASEEIAEEMLLEKYPDHRGYNLIVDLIDKHLSIEFL